MRSSTTPPVASSQHSVYCALPGSIRSRSLVRQALTKSAAPGPVTRALPRCDTSKTPTASRTAACSLSTPPPAYSSGISQPPNGGELGTERDVPVVQRRTAQRASVMAGNLPAIGCGSVSSRAGHRLAGTRRTAASD